MLNVRTMKLQRNMVSLRNKVKVYGRATVAISFCNLHHPFCKLLVLAKLNDPGQENAMELNKMTLPGVTVRTEMNFEEKTWSDHFAEL